MNLSINSPIKKGNSKLLFVWFENGSTATTVKEGQGVCYNADYGTATAADARRYNRVELPVSGNENHFAGVLVRNYTIPAGGRFVEVYAPGSVCNVLLLAGESTTIGATAVQTNFGDNFGKFTGESDSGKGVATALQSITGTAADQLCLAVLQEGAQSGLVDNS